MLLIFPPVAKPGEPPAGIAKLAGALKRHAIPCHLLDMNLEGLLYLLDQPLAAIDTWTRRAARNRAVNIAALRTPSTYLSLDRYSRAVSDVNRVLEVAGKKSGVMLSLADYQEEQRAPVRSRDLIDAAGHPEQNIFYSYFSRRLQEVLGKTVPSHVGFSLNYLSQALCTFSMIGFLRKEFPDVKIVLGGGLVTSWMQRPGSKNLFEGLVDHLVAGPGENALLSLLGATPSQEHCPPDFSSLPLGSYFSPGFVLPYAGSSGCSWNRCSFCPETAEGNPYFPVAPAHALADIAHVAGKDRPVLLHLLDNAVSPSLMRALAADPPGVPWYGFARIGRELADPDFCAALKRSGCALLKLGLESGDQEVLDALQKGIDLETASQALRNLSRAGIASYVYLLFGTPVETVGKARKTLDFVLRHRDCITFLNLAVFNMPAFGTEAGSYDASPFYEGDLSLYTAFRHPRGWERRQVREFLDNEFKRDPAVAAIVKNDPPLFTSNHAPFFGQH